MAPQPHQTDLGAGPVVRFDGVGLRYGRAAEVLKDLTFDLQPGSFHFLTGASGAGKTSLLRLVQLAMRPTRGLITLFGHDATHLKRRELPYVRRRIGVVYSDKRLLAFRQKPEHPFLSRGSRPWLRRRNSPSSSSCRWSAASPRPGISH